jgi:guanylate kinase
MHLAAIEQVQMEMTVQQDKAIKQNYGDTNLIIISAPMIKTLEETAKFEQLDQEIIRQLKLDQINLVNDTDLAGIDADDAFLRNLLFDSD